MTKKWFLPLLLCLIQAKPSVPGDAYEQAHHVRTGIGESWRWKRPWTPPAVAKSSPFLTKPMKKCSYWFILRKPSASNVAIDAMIRIKIVGSGAGEAWAAEEAMAVGRLN